jgi:hypothetical protein
MIPKKPGPDPVRAADRFSENHAPTERNDDSEKIHHAVAGKRRHGRLYTLFLDFCTAVTIFAAIFVRVTVMLRNFVIVSGALPLRGP